MSNKNRKVVIAGYVRSPFTPAGRGELKNVRSDDLIAQTVRGLVEKTGVDPKLIEDLKLGCAFPEGEQGLNLARHAIFIADLPKEIPAITINRFCGSSMQAIHDAAGAISMGMVDAVIAAGVESMSRIPMGGVNPMPNPDLYKNYPDSYVPMGETAENVVEAHGVTREEQDKFALSSQFKAAAAKKDGKFVDEIVPIVKKDGTIVSEDGCIRGEMTAEKLARLKPVFKAGGSVTAGTSSPLTDGASAVLVCSEEFAKKYGLKIMAEIQSFAVTGLDPNLMGMGPVSSTQKALKKAGLKIEDIDIFEINEAFSSQSVASAKKLGIDFNKVNKHGGAIALGHPLGASGARITGKAAKLLSEDSKAKYAVSTMCIGGGQGIATVLKKPSNNNVKAKNKKIATPKK